MIKWSLIELVSACICGNLLPLRPLLQRLMPSLRSAFSWYTSWSKSRSRSRKSSDKSTKSGSKWARLTGRGTGKRPKFLPTLHFTQVDLSPGWDYKKSEASDMTDPSSPCPAHFSGSMGSVDDHRDEEYGHKGPWYQARSMASAPTHTTHSSSGRSGKSKLTQ